MKCWFQIRDDEWVKGSITSVCGGKQVCFLPVDTSREATILAHPEFLFGNKYLSITGFRLMGEHSYTLESIFVSFFAPYKERA